MSEPNRLSPTDPTTIVMVDGVPRATCAICGASGLDVIYLDGAPHASCVAPAADPELSAWQASHPPLPMSAAATAAAVAYAAAQAALAETDPS